MNHNSPVPTYHINRSGNLIEILNNHGWVAANPDECADFSMWCSYDTPPREAKIKLFESRTSNWLDNKQSMYDLLAEYNEQEITLKVFSNLSDYLLHLKSTQSGAFCFLKTTLGAGGSGVYMFNDLKKLVHKLIELKDSSQTMIIQQGIRNVALIENRKFKIRSYILVTNDWQTYLYQDSLVVVHKEPYSPESTASGVQLSPNSGDTACLIHEVPGLAEVDLQIQAIALRTINCLKQKTAALYNSGSYHLFGYDFVCDEDYRAYLIEVNGFPNMGRNDPVGKSLSQRMMLDLKRLIIDPAISGTSAYSGGFFKVS